ncbi:hypothetical protein [Marinitoga aeolica]|uniref:Uncharacterized protein n=1 Tax=Marinitoga aeolica TaxID=2809031 RepID=A0ABY8PPU2_9BACT|nr:hypothetical protein [Marinitoga aeolica]WGS64653.1 hypothetical protein JRV97_09845 [Marinitoga aeolica]
MLFDKLPFEMDFEEMEKEIKNYFKNVEKNELLYDLIEAGFEPEELNLDYFFNETISKKETTSNVSFINLDLKSPDNKNDIGRAA